MECDIYKAEHQAARINVSTVHRQTLYFDEGWQDLLHLFLIKKI